MARPNFAGRFLAFMDGVVARAAVEPPVDLSLEAWKVAFASETSRISATTPGSESGSRNRPA